MIAEQSGIMRAMIDLRNAIDPDIAVARTRPSAAYYDADVLAALRERLFARSWRGKQSRQYDCGRYSPTREQGVHQYHRRLCEFAAV